MIAGTILTAIILSIIMTLAFSIIFNRRGRRGVGIWTFFLTLFFVMWAGGLWIYPIGPYIWGVSWVPLFVIGLVAGLLLTAIAPVTRSEISDTEGRRSNVNPAGMGWSAAGIFFWAVIIVLLIAIIMGYSLVR